MQKETKREHESGKENRDAGKNKKRKETETVIEVMKNGSKQLHCKKLTGQGSLEGYVELGISACARLSERLKVQESCYLFHVVSLSGRDKELGFVDKLLRLGGFKAAKL